MKLSITNAVGKINKSIAIDFEEAEWDSALTAILETYAALDNRDETNNKPSGDELDQLIAKYFEQWNKRQG